MRKILTIKNSKFSPPRGEHIFRVEDAEGESLGTLVRVEARSYRSCHSGTNRWDLFYFLPLSWEDWDDGPNGVLRAVVRPQSVSSAIIGRRNGENFFFIIEEKVSTPFGSEWRESDFTLSSSSFEDASSKELEDAAEAALQALHEGFGPHGEISNAHALEAWAKEVLGR